MPVSCGERRVVVELESRTLGTDAMQADLCISRIVLVGLVQRPRVLSRYRQLRRDGTAGS